MVASNALLVAIEALERLIEERERETEQYRMQLAQMRGTTVVVPPAKAGPYTGMGIVEASRLYLKEHGPQDTPDLARGLKEGGLSSKSHRLTPTVYATLANAAKGPRAQFTRTPEGKWALVPGADRDTERETRAHG